MNDEGIEIVRDPAAEANLKAMALWYAVFGAVPVAMVLSTRELPGMGTLPRGVQAAIGIALCCVFFGVGHLLSEFSGTARVVAKVIHIVALINAGIVFLSGLSWLHLLFPGLQNAVVLVGTAWVATNLLFYSAVSSPGAFRVCRPEYAEVSGDSPVPIGLVIRSQCFWAPLLLAVLAAVSLLMMPG
jgi:hypothetical protein